MSEWDDVAIDSNTRLERKIEKLRTRLAAVEAQLADANRGYSLLCDEEARLNDDLAAARRALEEFKEYHEWVLDKLNGPVALAAAHGWRESEDVVHEGKRRRAELGYVSPYERALLAPERPKESA